MDKKVYKFNLSLPVTFFKAGQYLADVGWRHKDIINDGDYELFIVLTGAVYIQIGTDKFELHQQDCLLIPPYIRHVGYKDSPENTNYYWLHFYPNGEVNSSYSHLKLKKGETLIPRKFHILNFERIMIMLRQLLDASNRQQALRITANYFVSSIIIELANQYREKEEQVANQEDVSRFEFIKNWIRIHSHEPLTVTQIADYFSITPTYLTRLFREQDQTTTIQFINAVKIQQAQQMLLTTDIPIKQIAMELGFQNEKYFFRVFKRATGVTASEFRNAYSKTYLNNLQVDPPIPKPKQI